MSVKFSNPLDNIQIASPCSQDWDAMIGVGRKRYCGECKLNVYNLSGMTRREAQSLLTNSEGRLCVRFYRRADGTVLTEDCPVGWRAIKRRAAKMATAFASLIFGLVGGLGLNSFMKDSDIQTIGRVVPQTSNSNANSKNPAVLMGEMGPPANYAMMGNIAAPVSKASNPEKNELQSELGGKSGMAAGKIISKNSPQM